MIYNDDIIHSSVSMNRSSTKTAASTPASEETKSATREPRGTRRRRETREKLLEAAFRLMAEQGSDGVTINEITEEADVGIGSFYNHFESKDAIYSAVLDQVFEEFGDALDALTATVTDPAEKIAVCIRHTVLRARRDPLWGRFLVREGMSVHAMDRGLGARLLRDIQAGLAKGRFKVPDPLMSFVALGSGVLGAISAQLELDTEHASLKKFQLDVNHLPERAAAVLLHGLGLSFEQAQKISQGALPVVGEPPLA